MMSTLGGAYAGAPPGDEKIVVTVGEAWERGRKAREGVKGATEERSERAHRTPRRQAILSIGERVRALWSVSGERGGG